MKIDRKIGLSKFTLRSDWNQNGFENLTDSSLTWTDTSPDRTLSVQPTGTSFNYFIDGRRYTSTGDTVQINATEGVHIIYYDGTTLTDAINPTNGEISNIIRTKATVSILYWDNANSTANYVGEERHGKSMSPVTHAYLHFLNGLAYNSGLGLNSIVADQNGSSNTHAQFGVDSGIVADEDLIDLISAVESTTGLPIYYLDGANGNIRKIIESGFSVLTDTTAGIGSPTGRLVYNQFTGGAWQLTTVANTDFVLCHVFATTEKDSPMIAYIGQNDYNTVTAAREGALAEIESLVLNNILFPEVRPIATIIFQTRDSYTNDINARIVSTDNGDDYIDWRNETISRVALSTSDHGTLTGLGNDDHLQYLLVDGTRDMTGNVSIPQGSKFNLEGSSGDTYFMFDGTNVFLYVNGVLKQTW